MMAKTLRDIMERERMTNIYLAKLVQVSLPTVERWRTTGVSGPAEILLEAINRGYVQVGQLREITAPGGDTQAPSPPLPATRRVPDNGLEVDGKPKDALRTSQEWQVIYAARARNNSPK